MNALVKNPEFKSVLVKLLIFQLVTAAAFFILNMHEGSLLNKDIISQNEALAGKLLGAHPELEGELVGLMTRTASEGEISAGKKVLDKYGYSRDMPVYLQPVLNTYLLRMGYLAPGLAMLFLLPLILLIGIEYGKVFRKVREFTTASEKVVEGSFTFIPEDTEGDFGMLGHSFNQMADRLKLSLETVLKEKIFLKDIISDISHQLKTPLSSLITFNELLLQEKVTDKGTRQEFLERSQTQLDRMEWLVISLLKLARLEAGSISFRKDRLLLAEPVESAASAVKIILEKKGQRLTVTGSSETAGFMGDVEWTAEALTNIMKNSSEHMGIGGEMRVNISETPLFSRISIEDNGEGIDPKDLPHIFERFYRGSSAVKTEGTGIGLAIAKLIIEGQDGLISVRSEKGKGTEFVITFPKGII